MNTRSSDYIVLIPFFKDWQICLVKFDACNHILARKVINTYSEHQRLLAIQDAREEAERRGIPFLNEKINIKDINIS